MVDPVRADADCVRTRLGDLTRRFAGTRILITGHRGFLGANFCAFFARLAEVIALDEVVCIDDGRVALEDLTTPWTRRFTVVSGDPLQDLPDLRFRYVIHCAGIASPAIYRQQPLATIDANAISYWKLLSQLRMDTLAGLLYFSSSEIYGSPPDDWIPTPEEFPGNVSCTGPRACYDESKRLGETISCAFVAERGLPVKIVRPFNVYGPLMRSADGRVIADFARGALCARRIELRSNGSPTRTFTYVSDAIEGFLRALLLGTPGRPYNIGADASEETSMAALAARLAALAGGAEVVRRAGVRPEELQDDPRRRAPDCSRAYAELGYRAGVSLEDGLRRTMDWYRIQYGACFS